MLSALHAALAEPHSDAGHAATTAFTRQLDRYADTDDWRHLVSALRRMHAGERKPEAILAGLDDIDTAVARRALDVLAGTAAIDPDAWRTLVRETPSEQDRMAAFIAAFAKAAAGDAEARAAVEPQLIHWASDQETAALAAALRCILDGTDDPTQDGDLPENQAQFLAAVRRHLAPSEAPPETEPETS